MRFQDILHGKQFNTLAAVLSVAFQAQPSPHNDLYSRLKTQIPFWSLWKRFCDVTPVTDDWNTDEVIDAFTSLLLAVTQAAPEILWYTESDIRWFVAVLDSGEANVTIQMLKAWISADDCYLTPGQVAGITGMSESNWRNRAAGQPGYKPIPGCKKPGHDWLIPLSVLQASGDVDWSYKPDQSTA